MSFPTRIEIKSNINCNPNENCKSLYKGACVKIKNNQKIFQIVGLNPKSKVCWIREWPLDLEVTKTFSLGINEIIMQTLCPKSSSEK